ncbi:hypothetical protein Cni_G10191 [Canna indica]|uniref:Carbohydrate kinase PfkB domain-containing protein n=1 Tax=Canna indica TaxID=4628 RepID=A0AAQ3K5P8_9LILI|nr:hypothetical protein Cni_G10191 [Canna indica]
MGASESLLSQQQLQQQQIDEITTVSERIEGIDPLLEGVRALKIAKSLLNSPPPAESIFVDSMAARVQAFAIDPRGEGMQVLQEVDTTGAGDAFVGAFLWKLVDDQSVLQVDLDPYGSLSYFWTQLYNQFLMETF